MTEKPPFPKLFLLGTLLLAVTPALAQDDGVELRATKVAFGGLGAQVQLTWTGGSPEFAVHRATTIQDVLSPTSLVTTTFDRGWNDSGISGDNAFFLVRGRANCWKATADAWVDAQFPNDNYGGEDTLEARNSPVRNSYLQFPVANAVPRGAQILSATFMIEQVGGNGGSYIGLQQVRDPWTEDGVTYATRPGIVAGYGTTYLSSSTGTRQWNLTQALQQWTDGTAASFGIELIGWDEADYAIFSAREDVAPLLCVEWTTALESAAAQLRIDSQIPVKIQADRGVAISVEAEVSGGLTPYNGATAFLDNYGGLFGLTDPPNETFLDRTVTDDFGRTTFIFGTRTENIPNRIEQIAVQAGSEIIFPIFTSKVYGATATLLPAVQKVREPANVVLTPREARLIAEEAVVTGAVERTGEPYLEWFDPNLEVDQGMEVRPTWHVAFKAQETPTSGWVEWVANVDAETGDLLRAHTVELTGDRPGENFKVRTANYTNKGGCWDTTTVDDPWFDEDGSLPQYPGGAGDSYSDGNNTYWGTHDIYHLFYDRFSRESWNGRGKKVRAMVDVTDPDTGGLYDNAYYDRGCNMMVYGDGIAVRDVIGHEFTHGVVRWTAELEYINQSGALNESYADYFGSLVDGDWEMGDRLYGDDPLTPPIRDISDPPRFNHPDHRDAALSGDLQGLRSPVSANSASKSNDYGGVHSNSGIPNKVFYLMTDGGSHNGLSIAGMGDTKAARLLYDALVHDYHKKTGFWVARGDIVRRVKRYYTNGNYGITLQDVCDTINAWSSVGYGEPDLDCDGSEDSPVGDSDGDGVPNNLDNCSLDPNAGQQDLDGDGAGDACDPDIDNDGDRNDEDNCIRRWNADQADTNRDGIGDACDSDHDTVRNSMDNCPMDYNPRQVDTDGDAMGDECDDDDDNDGLLDGADNCPTVYNITQLDWDNDNVGNFCDNCQNDYNPDQANADNDNQGDVCDGDDDNDMLLDGDDNCPQYYNPRQIDNDGNGIGMWCDGGELFMLQGFAEQVELDIFVQDNDLLNPIRFPIFPCVAGTTCPTVLPEVFITQVLVDVQPAYLVRIVDDRGYEMAHAEYDPSGLYTLEFAVDHEYSYTAIGATQTYEGRRYFVEMIAPDGASPGVVTGTINVETTDQTP